MLAVRRGGRRARDFAGVAAPLAAIRAVRGRRRVGRPCRREPGAARTSRPDPAFCAPARRRRRSRAGPRRAARRGRPSHAVPNIATTSRRARLRQPPRGRTRPLAPVEPFAAGAGVGRVASGSRSRAREHSGGAAARRWHILHSGPVLTWYRPYCDCPPSFGRIEVRLCLFMFLVLALQGAFVGGAGPPTKHQFMRTEIRAVRRRGRGGRE
jgi:hypothetical protein